MIRDGKIICHLRAPAQDTGGVTREEVRIIILIDSEFLRRVRGIIAASVVSECGFCQVLVPYIKSGGKKSQEKERNSDNHIILTELQIIVHL